MPLIQQPTPFNDADWLFEVKHDGFRSLAYIQDGACRLVSRKGHEYRHKRLQELARALSTIPHEVIRDGELACLDDEGRTLFYDMMFNRAPVHFYAFDIMWLDGEDLRDTALVERQLDYARLNIWHPQLNSEGEGPPELEAVGLLPSGHRA